MADTEIEEIYCTKCKKYTKTLNGMWGETEERKKPILSGECNVCGKIKCVFTNKEGIFKRKTPKELKMAREERKKKSLNRKVFRMSKKILEAAKDDPNVLKYVRQSYR